MKLRLKERLVSFVLAAGMIVSPAGTGVTVLSAVAEETAVSETIVTTEETSSETTVPTEETEETPSETTVPTEETEETPSETTVLTEETEETPSETTAPTEETEETPSETTVPTEETEETPSETTVPTEETEETSSETTVSDEETDEEFVYDDPVIEKTGDIIPYAIVERFFTAEELEQVEQQVVIPVVMAEQRIYSGRYAYNALTSDEKLLYNSIYSLASSIHNSTENYNHTGTINYTDGTSKTTYVFGSSPIKITTGASYDSIYKAFLAVGYDNPQFFWLGHTMEVWGSNTTGIYTSVRLCTENYDCSSGSSRQQLKTRYENEVKSVLSEAAYYGNDYSKEYFVTNYICDKTKYVMGASHAHDALGVLLYGESVCEGYSKAFQTLMNAMDIPVNYVIGQGNGGGHGWNQVCLDDEWYNYDATWIDSDYTLYYDWFNVTDSGFRYHTAGEGFYWLNPTFTCTASKYSYANHASNYVTTFNECTINGIEKATLTEALEYITETNDSTAEYEIVLTRNIKADSIVIPPFAAKVTITGGSLEIKSGMVINSDTVIDTEIIGDGIVVSVGGGKTLTLGDNFKGGNLGLVSGEGAYLNIGGAGLSADSVTGFALVSGTSLDVYSELKDVEKLDVEKLSILSIDADVRFSFDNDLVLEMLYEDNRTCGAVADSFGNSLTIKLITAVKEKNGVVTREYGSVPGNVCILYSNTDILSSTVLENMVDDAPAKLKYNFEEGTVTTVSDMPVLLEADGFSVGYKTIAEAVKAMNDKNADYTVTLVSAMNVDSLTLPAAAKANSVKFKGESLTIGNTSLKITTDAVFENKIIFSSANGVNITVSTGKNLTLNETEGTVNAVSGSAASMLKCGVLTASKVKSFGTIECSELTILESMSSVKSCTGILNVSAGASVIMTEPDGRLEINAETEDGKLPSITINSAGENAEIIFTALSDIASGTVIVSSKNDISEKITVTNTAEGKEMGAFYYTKAKCIKAELADAVTLIANGSEGRNFPNLELALASMNNENTDYTVRLNIPAKEGSLLLHSASKSKSVTYTCEKITLNIRSLKINTDISFECALGTEIPNGISVSVAAGRTFAAATTDSNVFSSVSGTATSVLRCGTMSVQSLRGFGLVEAENIIVSKSASGIKDLKGRITISDTSASVILDNITGNGEIYAAYENGRLPKITVNSAEEGSQLGFAAVTAGTIAALPNGTVIISSKKDISGNINIINTTTDGKKLDSFYYKKNKGIKAEVADAFTLCTNGSEGRNFPNLDLIFETMTDQTADYTVKINTPANAEALLVSKVKANSVTFTGESLTVASKSLKIPFSMIVDCEFISTAAGGMTVTVAAGKTLTLNTNAADGTFNTITGSATSVFNCKRLAASSVRNFGLVNAEELIITKSASGIKDISGVITAENGSSVIIDNVSGTVDIKAAYTNGIIPKITINNAGSEAEIRFSAVTDGEIVRIPNSTVILYAGKNDITSKITVANKDAEGRDLNAFLYKREIRAECAEAITVYSSRSDSSRDFPNLEKAFESMTDPEEEYVVMLNSDIYCNKLTMPKKAGAITFIGAGGMKTLNVGNTTSISASDITFTDINIESNKKLKISASSNLTMNGFTSDSLTSVSGGKNARLVWDQPYSGNYDISGFGRVVVNSGAVLGTGSKFNVSALEIQDGGVFTVNRASRTIIKYLDGCGEMMVAEGFSPVTISSGTSGSCKVSLSGAVKDGDVIFTSKNADTEAFDVTNITPEGDVEYGLVNIKGKLYFKGRLLEMDGIRYTLWSEMIGVIESKNDNTAEYNISVLDNTDIGGALKMPKTGTYKQINITAPEDTDFMLTFTGSIALTGDLSVSNIGLRSVTSKGAEATFGISTGKNVLVLENIRSNGIKSVSGTSGSSVILKNVAVNGVVNGGNVMLENVLVTGKVKAMTNLEITENAEIRNAVNAESLSGNVSVLTLAKGKLVAVGKGGTTGTVILRYTDSDGTAVSFSGKTKIGTCAGKYDNNLYISEENGNVSVEKSGNILYASVN